MEIEAPPGGQERRIGARHAPLFRSLDDTIGGKHQSERMKVGRECVAELQFVTGIGVFFNDVDTLK